MVLVLKHKWFDMIASGIKREEYRRITPRYLNQLEKLINKPKSERIIDFRRGYTKTRLLIRCENVLYYHPSMRGARCGTCFSFGNSYMRGNEWESKPEWGFDKTQKQFIIVLGDIINHE